MEKFAKDAGKGLLKNVAGVDVDKTQLDNFKKNNQKPIKEGVQQIVNTICERIHKKDKRKLVTEDIYNKIKDRIVELYGGGISEKLWEYLPYFEGKPLDDYEIEGFYKKLGIDVNKSAKTTSKNTNTTSSNVTTRSNVTNTTNTNKQNEQKIAGDTSSTGILQVDGGKLKKLKPVQFPISAQSGGKSIAEELGSNPLSKESFTSSIKIICNYINENPTYIMPLIDSFNNDFKKYLDEKLDKKEFINLIQPFSKQFIQKLKNKSIADIDIKDVFTINDAELLNKRYKIPISYFDKYNKNDSNDAEEKKSILAGMKEREQELPNLINKINEQITTKEEEQKTISIGDRTKMNESKTTIKDLKKELYELEKEKSTMDKINYLIKRKTDEMCVKFGKEIKQSAMNMDNGKPQTNYNNAKTEKCDMTAKENETTTNFIKKIREYQLTQADLDTLSRKGGKKSYKQKKNRSNRRKTIKYKKTRL
jgi:hypothetical protein